MFPGRVAMLGALDASLSKLASSRVGRVGMYGVTRGAMAGGLLGGGLGAYRGYKSGSGAIGGGLGGALKGSLIGATIGGVGYGALATNRAGNLIKGLGRRLRRP